MHTTSSLFLCFLLLLSTTVVAQINPEIEFPTLKESGKLEKNSGGQLVGKSELTISMNPTDGIPQSKKVNARIYKRPSTSFPLTLHVWYLFDNASKAASGIIYNWGLYNPSFNANENVALLLDLNKQESAFVEKFDSLYSTIVQKFGEPDFSEEDIDE
ncbi:MAG: hypothetical protein ACXIUD_00310 [Mongoliitalea sp.]